MTTDLTDQSENGNNPVADAKLRRYLLGGLAGDERLELDERLLLDDELAESVRLAESVLIDDYATGKLSQAERQLFESNFLVSDERKESLRLSGALREYAHAPTASVTRIPHKLSWSERLAGLFALNSPRGWAVAGSFAVLILLVAGAWFLFRKQTEPGPLIAKNEPPAVNSSAADPKTSSSQGQSATGQPTPPAVPSPTPPEPPVPATVANFVLLPGALRSSGGEMTRVAVPGGERDIVRLSLVLETPSEDSYQAELVTAEGQKVLVRPNLKITRNGKTKIVLTVPARLLQTRDYQVRLTRQKPDGQSESAGRYYFRALDE